MPDTEKLAAKLLPIEWVALREIRDWSNRTLSDLLHRDEAVQILFPILKADPREFLSHLQLFGVVERTDGNHLYFRWNAEKSVTEILACHRSDTVYRIHPELVGFLRQYDTEKPDGADAGSRKTGEIIPASRNALAQALLTNRHNERSSGKSIEALDREFFEKNKRRFGKSNAEQAAAFKNAQSNARRCLRRVRDRA